MSSRFGRTRWLAVLGTVAALALAGVAIAYFTSTGAGTGTAQVGSVAAGDVVIHGTVAADELLFPGGDPVTVPITVTNDSDAPVKVGTVSLTGIAADSGHATCDVSITGEKPSFTMAPVTIGQTVDAGGTSTEVDGSLAMNDTGVNQDACQGATLTLTFSSTAG